ncbi:hypothetical protein E3O21_17255 [Cryobacterium flavum]|uniref:Mutator family transposase n=1 Tax=Cryobacterium flavum TaxID=1424659 RepID=A0ABY2HXK0_9MICO|nr:hypothetical protein E3O21_17255 [Cryobacterium flavum]
MKKAIGTVFQGASWQRCRVHQMRNILSIVPRASQEMVASVIRTIFAQPDAKHVQAQFDEVTRMLEHSHPQGRPDAPRRPRNRRRQHPHRGIPVPELTAA